MGTPGAPVNGHVALCPRPGLGCTGTDGRGHHHPPGAPGGLGQPHLDATGSPSPGTQGSNRGGAPDASPSGACVLLSPTPPGQRGQPSGPTDGHIERWTMVHTHTVAQVVPSQHRVGTGGGGLPTGTPGHQALGPADQGQDTEWVGGRGGARPGRRAAFPHSCPGPQAGTLTPHPRYLWGEAVSTQGCLARSLCTSRAMPDAGGSRDAEDPRTPQNLVS